LIAELDFLKPEKYSLLDLESRNCKMGPVCILGNTGC
jgi:hypothetical protein